MAELRAQFSAALIRASRAWRSQVDAAVGSLDLSEAKGWALINIHRLGDGVRQVTVADAIGIEGPTFVRLLDQLCASALVERREDQGDRRAKTLHLTSSGVSLVAALETRLHAVRLGILEDVSRADLEACLRVFRAVEEAKELSAAATKPAVGRRQTIR